MSVCHIPHGAELIAHHPELIHREAFKHGGSVGDQRSVEGSDAFQAAFRELDEDVSAVAVVAPPSHEALALEAVDQRGRRRSG